MDLSKLTTPKIKELKENLNLTDEEEMVFDMLCKRKAIVEISCRSKMSESTVSRRIQSIKKKIKKLENEYNFSKTGIFKEERSGKNG